MSDDLRQGLKGTDNLHAGLNSALNDPAQPSYPALEFKPEAYLGYLQDMPLSESQKQELLEALWLIMVSVVDLRFGPQPFCCMVQEVLGDPQSLQPDASGVLGFADGISDNPNKTIAASPARE